MDEPRYGASARFRLSQSSLESYLKCGLRYFLERELKRPRATWRQACGTATAAAVRLLLEEVARGHKGRVGLDDMCQVATNSYQASEILNDIVADEDTPDIAERLERMIAAYRADLLRYWVPYSAVILGCEIPVIAPIDDWELCATIDVLTSIGVGELKTGRRWTADRVDANRQLSAYTLAASTQGLLLPCDVWVDTIYPRPRNREGLWQGERIMSQRTEEDCARFVRIARKAKSAIQAGTALPAPEGAWWCSRKWCPVWEECPVMGGKGNGKQGGGDGDGDSAGGTD